MMGSGESVGAGVTRRPTIYDVAREAGVSKSLVSLVLQGRGGVSPPRRAAVEAAIEKLRYWPSQSASQLAGDRSMTVGVVLDDYRNLWFVDALEGLEHQLSPHGFRVAVATQREADNALGRSPLDGFLSLRVDGLVVAMEPTSAMRLVHDTPVVVIGERELVLPHAAVVSTDNFAGAQMATRHLLDLGHREIAHVSAPGGMARRRREGYLQSMRDAGLPAVVSMADGSHTEGHAYDATRELLTNTPVTTAIFAANDTMALGAVAAARDAGLRVPEDISVVGYDNSPLAASHLLQLTTVDARPFDVGVQVADLLTGLLGASATPTASSATTLVQPKFVQRTSTAPPRTRR